MAQQALYDKLLESRIFDNQEEAMKWAKEKKNDYREAGNSVKTTIVPADATRRRWKAAVYIKV